MNTRRTQAPLLDRRATEIARLRTELSEAKARIVELEAQLEAAKKKK